MTTSVTIVTKNRHDELMKCLLSIKKQNIIPNELIIVDSSIQSAEYEIKKMIGNIQVVYFHLPSYNIPQARNLSFRRAKSSLILTIDDDCTAKKDWIASMIALHVKHPDVLAVQGRAISMPRDSIYSIIMETYREAKIYISHHLKEGTRYLGTYNAAFKSNLLKRNNISFDESIKRSSDVDLAAQICSKNQTIIYSSNPVVFFNERVTLRDFLFQRYQGGAGAYDYTHKWPKNKFFSFYSISNMQAKVLLKIIKMIKQKKKYNMFLFFPFLLFFSTTAFIIGFYRRKP